MSSSGTPISLVERKKYDADAAHQFAQGIWWVGYIDRERSTSHNSWLIVDGTESILINPGSRARKNFRIVSRKVASITSPGSIQHIIVLHNDPDRCAALPLFEKMVHRDARIYTPSGVTASIGHYGCKRPVIGLDDGDSIILESGRTLDYHATPNLPSAGSGLLHDRMTRTIFCGNVFGIYGGEWNLFAPANAWRSFTLFDSGERCSKKALMHALNRIERLSPDRICMQYGPVIEDDVDGYINAARDINCDK